MRRLAALVAITLVAAAIGVVGVGTWRCSQWQDDYKLFLYSEVLRNSPIIYTPKDIDRIIGSRPIGCVRPESLDDEDLARYRREHVGPNEFVDQIRNVSAFLSPVGRFASKTPFVVGLNMRDATRQIRDAGIEVFTMHKGSVMHNQGGARAT